MLRSAGNPDGALAQFRAGLAQNPSPQVASFAYLRMGQIFRQNGQMAEAVEAFKKAIRAKPELGEAYDNLGSTLRQLASPQRAAAAQAGPKPEAAERLKRGRALLAQSNPADAAREFRECVKIDAHFAEGYSLLGFALGQSGNLPEAIVALRTAVELDPQSAHARYNLGAALWYAGQRSAALAEMQKVQNLDPGDLEVYAFRGVVLKEQGDYSGALDNLACAISLDHNYVPAFIHQGVVLLRTGRISPALVQFQQALDLDPRAATGQLDFCEAIDEIRHAVAGRTDIPEAHFVIGELLSRNGARADEIIAEYKECLRQDPAFYEAHNGLGLMFVQLGETEEAVSEFGEAVHAAPGYAEGHANLGSALLDSHPEQAVNELEDAIRLQPGLGKVHYDLALAYRKLDQTDKETDELRQAIDADPRSAAPQAILGSVLLANKSYEQASVALRKAVSLDSRLASAHHDLSLALDGLGQHAEAVSESTLAEQLDAQQERRANAQAAITRADLAVAKGDWATAGAQFRDAVGMDPTSAKAHEGLAESLFNFGKTDQAIGEFRQALLLRPGYFQAEFYLGKALCKRQDWQHALARLQNAVRQRPLFAEAYNQLGLAWAGKGDYDEAGVAFRKALKLDPQFLDAQNNLKKIGKLK